ncbi:MAG: glycosyltransferase, partial [Nevskiales bacterium]
LFARGEYLVVYDAEDQPEPDQLKKALLAFQRGPRALVCVQAALNYYNWNENFLTRMFTLEYSFWFDYLLPGLDRLGLPIPLGGTSNHFRTTVLRELGGWDPFNVTEDADLGIRAAMHGYRVGIVNSTTFEEANKQLGNWIRQRSRWIKGYMQTALVFSRDPYGLVRRAGWKHTLGFALLIGGTPLIFLIQPISIALTLVWLFTRNSALEALFPPVVLYISLFNLLIGNALAIYVNMFAVFKRRLHMLVLFSLFNPLYWVLHSIASFKALGQLFTKPYYWEKTTHGLTRHGAAG